MLKIVTDTGSDLTYEGAKELDIISLEIGINFEGIDYDIRSDLDFSMFYENLVKSKNLPTTSQITPQQYLDVFNEAKEKGDEVLAITLSSGLSGTYQSALMAQQECGYGKITVVDSTQALIPQRMLTEHAAALRAEGKSREEIAEEITALREQLVVCGMLDTLTYLKKGGRVPPALALIGNIMKLKPVITLEDGKIEPIGKARGTQAGKQLLLSQMDKDGFDESWPVWFSHTNDPARGEAFMKEVVAKYSIKNYRLVPTGAVIGTHLGPGALIIAYKKK